jgi:hypothetical protein
MAPRSLCADHFGLRLTFACTDLAGVAPHPNGIVWTLLSVRATVRAARPFGGRDRVRRAALAQCEASVASSSNARLDIDESGHFLSSEDARRLWRSMKDQARHNFGCLIDAQCRKPRRAPMARLRHSASIPKSCQRGRGPQYWLEACSRVAPLGAGGERAMASRPAQTRPSSSVEQ